MTVIAKLTQWELGTMPPFEEMDLTDDAVYWPIEGRDKHGEPLIGDAVPIECRWVESQTEALDPTGATIPIDVTVKVDREIAIDSILWKGRLEDFDPTEKPVLMQVKTKSTTPDIKGRHVAREIGLMFYKKSLPAPKT